MNAFETKKLLISLAFAAAALLLLPHHILAVDSSSAHFTVQDPVIDSGFKTSASANFGLGQSLSQIAIGKSSSASFQLWSGFQYFYLVTANVLTAAPGNDNEVDLNWTVPSSYLGISPATYQVGTGTTSGSYTFENVGGVTSFTKTGLTAGTTYYFIVKAFSAGGTFLVFSNQDSAIPTGTIPEPPPGNGGSGGSIYTGALSLTGKAYPNSTVTILRDSVIINTVTADAAGDFFATMYGMAPGTYSFSLYATDAGGVKSPNLAFERSIANSVVTSVNNLLVAPTIKTNLAQVKQGEVLQISGYTAPNSPVTLSFAGGSSFLAQTTSDISGFYKYLLDTANLPKNQYTVFARANISGTNTPNGFSVYFRIGDQSIDQPTPGTCSSKSDLNCDARVNLVDFSILLYFWDLNNYSKNPRVDIDDSGSVGLRDLSIMLYDWTG